MPPRSAADAVSEARCLQVDVAEDEVDVVSGVLWSGGATGVQELPLGAGRVRLVAGFPPSAEARLMDRLAPRVVDCFDAEHDGWLDAWRPFARPTRVGRVVIHPPWEPPPWVELPTDDDDLVVAIDPGRAFGAGNHTTTRLMIDALQTAVAPTTRVLDVGCGSGVLAVVAARLGALTVRAVDVEDEAVRATIENAARNDVSDRVEASTTPTAEVDGVFDLVVANILAPVLVELAPAIVERCRPGGRILLSGLHGTQADAVIDAYATSDTGIELVDRTADGDWLRLVLAH